MTAKASNNPSRRFAIVVIAVCIAMQLSTFVYGTRVWPFMAYCMYSDAHDPGPIKTGKRVFVAITNTGQEHFVTPELLNQRYHAFKKNIALPIYNGDESAARSLARRVEPLLSATVDQIRVTTYQYELTEDDIVESIQDSQSFDVRRDTP